MGKKTVLAAALLAAGVSHGAGATGFEWGGDLRFRLTTLDDIPTNVPGLSLDMGFNRDRIRLWAKYSPNEDVTFMGRLVNEFRFYDGDRRQAPTSWDPMTEVTPDQLYADFNNLAGGKLNVRVGRQNIKYGSGKIIADGTPLDGSRTDFFDGVKASLALGSHNIDLLALFAQSEPALMINDQDRKLVEQDEMAFGLYGKSKFDTTGYEYYWIYKEEDGSLTSTRTKADAEFHTLGGRIMPKFGNGLSANVEFAFQDGDHGDEDMSGRLFDATLSFSPDVWGSLKPKFSVGYYYLSGNDIGGSDNEAWHPVFSRIPQFGELQGYSYVGSQFGPFGWSNFSAPWVGMDMSPFKDSRLILRYYRMGADVADGPGPGDDRGDSFWALLLFKINPQLNGHLWAEYLNTGDYFGADPDDAVFIRANLEYKF